MATALDIKIAPKLKAVIEKFGVTATIEQPGARAYHATDGKVDAGPVTSVQVKVSPPAPYSQRLVDGANVLASDCMVTVLGQDLSFTPTPLMKITVSGKTWKIVSVRPLYSGDLVAAYELQVRA